MNVLMIEDDLDLGRGLVATLKGHSMGCQWIRRAADAPHSFTEFDCDCVLLDLSLPDGEGHDLLARWRREPAVHAVRLKGQPIDLTPREFAVLRELARTPGMVVSKEKLSKRLSPFGEPLETAVIEVHVFNLRKKIGADLIHTVRGVGYLLAT